MGNIAAGVKLVSVRLANCAWIHLKRWRLCGGDDEQHRCRGQIVCGATCEFRPESSEAVAAVLRR